VSNASKVWREAVSDADRRARGADRPSAEDASARRGGTAPATPDGDAAIVDAAELADATSMASRAARAEEEWVLVEEVRDEAAGAVARGSSARRRPSASGPPDLAEEVRQQLSRAVGTARSERVERRLREAADDFEHERFGDANRVLKKLSDEAPTVAAVRELYGLTLYRQEKWRAAAKELEAYRLLSGGVDQLPVLADCYRAMRQWAMVDELWQELGAASPDAATVTEGRIVVAGAHADRGDLTGALALLTQGWRFPQNPKIHHLRRAYALADVYERLGEVPRARDLFARIEAAEPGFADVDRRLRSLG